MIIYYIAAAYSLGGAFTSGALIGGNYKTNSFGVIFTTVLLWPIVLFCLIGVTFGEILNKAAD